MTEDIGFANGHTVLLIQFSKNDETRFYLDSKNPQGCMESICRIYENFLLNKLGILNEGGTEEAQRASNLERRNVEY